MPPITVTTRPATAPTTAASDTVPASRARTQARTRRGTSNGWVLTGAWVSAVITITKAVAAEPGQRRASAQLLVPQVMGRAKPEHGVFAR